MLRFEIAPAVVELRQLSNVHAPYGWGSGQGLFSAFSTASACVMFVPQVGQEQVHLLSLHAQLQGFEETDLQLDEGSTGTIFSMVTVLSSSCCCDMLASYTFFT